MHFCVAVFTDKKNGSVEDLLEPFDEQYSNSMGINTCGKWDWYCIGGRYSDTIPLKDSSFGSEALMVDVNYKYFDEKTYEKCLRVWELCMDHLQPISESDKDLFNNWHIYSEKFFSRHGSAEEFAKNSSYFRPYAMLTPDGEWLESDDFSAKDWAEKAGEIFAIAEKNNWKITVVDCHI